MTFAARISTLPGLTRALVDAGRAASHLVSAGLDAVIEVRESAKNRTAEQNKKLHAMLTDISEQCELGGNRFSMEIWKRMCVAQWLKDCGERPKLVPSIDGLEVVVIYEKTSKLNTKQTAELIEWLYSYGAENDVKWTEPKQNKIANLIGEQRQPHI